MPPVPPRIVLSSVVIGVPMRAMNCLPTVPIDDLQDLLNTEINWAPPLLFNVTGDKNDTGKVEVP